MSRIAVRLLAAITRQCPAAAEKKHSYEEKEEAPPPPSFRGRWGRTEQPMCGLNQSLMPTTVQYRFNGSRPGAVCSAAAILYYRIKMASLWTRQLPCSDGLSRANNWPDVRVWMKRTAQVFALAVPRLHSEDGGSRRKTWTKDSRIRKLREGTSCFSWNQRIEFRSRRLVFPGLVCTTTSSRAETNLSSFNWSLIALVPATIHGRPKELQAPAIIVWGMMFFSRVHSVKEHRRGSYKLPKPCVKETKAKYTSSSVYSLITVFK